MPLGLDPATRDRLVAAYAMQDAMCLRLERIADGLPDAADRTDCLVVAQSLAPMLRMAHLLEEVVLIRPLLMSAGAMAETAHRLQGEHWEDESFADEISEALTEYLDDRSTRTALSLGYMLRGFFMGLRRHIAFEREHLLRGDR